MKQLRCLHLLIAPIIILSSCARQTSPSGGPKDSIPPKLQISIPKNGSTNYKLKEVELHFDEFIALNNPKEQIIITPDVQKKYDIVARKNKVTLTFDNPLLDSTTYTINFRNSVQDITEKNNARNLKVAFSTGTYIDSLSISGKVSDPLMFKDIKQATVALYTSDTFSIFKHKPVILTETDDKGNFALENLKPSKYFIYAILDKNKNLIADSKTELYGFLTDSIHLTSNVKSVNIDLQKLDTRNLKLISARPYNTYYNIKTSKNLRSYKLASNTKQLYSTFAETTDNIKLFNPGITENDSIPVRLIALDSTDNKLDTTLYAKFLTKKSRPEPFSVKTEGFKALHTKGMLTGTLRYTKPIAQINTDSIYYEIDSATTIVLKRENFRIDTLHNTIHVEQAIDKKLLAKPETQNQKPTVANGQRPNTNTQSEHKLIFGKGAFVSIEQDSSIRIEEPLKPTYFDETGIVFINVETSQPFFVVELLDNAFKIVRSTSNKKKITFEDLPPADYQIRLVIDTNNDRQWTPGNFQKRQNAEKTVLYKNEKGNTQIKLKANFEIGPLLIKY